MKKTIWLAGGIALGLTLVAAAEPVSPTQSQEATAHGGRVATGSPTGGATTGTSSAAAGGDARSSGTMDGSGSGTALDAAAERATKRREPASAKRPRKSAKASDAGDVTRP